MSEKKRTVLFLVESLDGGRAGKMLSTLVQYLDRTKFDVTVCSVVAGGSYESVIKENVNYKPILAKAEGMRYKMVYKNLPMSMVYKMFVPQDFDVEIACSEGFVTKLLSNSSNKRAKKYAWVHTNLSKVHWTKDVFGSPKEETAAYNRFDKVVCVSNVVADAFRQVFEGVTKPVEAIYTPLDSLSVRLKALNATEESGTPVKFRLVTRGNLEGPQEYGRLLRVVNRLVKENYDLGLWIFGDGSERGILENYVRKNELTERVKLFGAHPNPYRYMVQGDLFVCSTFTISVISALILGLPVLATKTPELNEILKDGLCAYMTENSEDAIYAGLKKLLDDPALLAQYRQKGEARGWDFDIEAMMVPVENLLNS